MLFRGQLYMSSEPKEVSFMAINKAGKKAAGSEGVSSGARLTGGLTIAWKPKEGLKSERSSDFPRITC